MCTVHDKQGPSGFQCTTSHSQSRSPAPRQRRRADRAIHAGRAQRLTNVQMVLPLVFQAEQRMRSSSDPQPAAQLRSWSIPGPSAARQSNSGPGRPLVRGVPNRTALLQWLEAIPAISLPLTFASMRCFSFCVPFLPITFLIFSRPPGPAAQGTWGGCGSSPACQQPSSLDGHIRTASSGSWVALWHKVRPPAVSRRSWGHLKSVISPIISSCFPPFLSFSFTPPCLQICDLGPAISRCYFEV
ncbi:hypothetical protein M432DRAFT_373996 [Thermoascus aurantiacus ATCC 26904]